MEARGYKDVFPSSSFLGVYVLLEGCELHHTRLAQRHKGLTLFSGEPHHKGLVHLPLLEGESGAFTMSLGHTPTTELGAPEQLQVTTRGLNHHKESRVQRPKNNKLTNFHFHESSWRERTDAQCNGKSTSAQILHSQIPPKATNAYGGRREDRKSVV